MLLGRPFVGHGLVDRQAQVVFQWQLQQCLIVTAHHDQVGAAINLCALMVVGQLLGAVVAAGQAGDPHLADTEGLYLAQVFFKYQAPHCQGLIIHVGQQRLQRIRCIDHLLPAAGASQHRLDAHWAVEQQQACRSAGIGFAEHGVATQQRIAGLQGEGVGPAWREAGVGRQRMGDRLGRHVGIGDQPAEQVLLGTDTQRGMALWVDQRFGRYIVVAVCSSGRCGRV
ncbi:hypothetical protein D3C79_676690 [compost metagenome]